MFSRLDHHHQSGPAPHLARSPPATTPFGSIVAHTDPSVHHRHLETLLDSALATLTLIGHCHTSLPYSPHLLGVFSLLSCHIAPQSTLDLATPPPPPTIRPTERKSSLSTPSDDARPSDPHSPTTPEPNKAKPIAESPRARVSARESPAHVIIRFDKGTQPVPVPRPSAATLYEVITDTLRPLFPKPVMNGVRWTRGGNLALHPAEALCTAKLLASHSDTIWPAIRPLLQIPGTENRRCPAFDTDDKWHSVVFHGVPIPAPKIDAWKLFTRDRIEEWVTSPSSQGTLRECSILCRPENIEKKTSVALRLSFSSAAEAEQLVQKGGYMFGVACRVSHYVPKPRSPPPVPP
ncbi:hypothetical protein C8R47DRAFT_1139375 [Mycena vitilis]|nr:hypothetical protein C8R47DRAFT_1139375 [Mycena vitilis]